MKLKQMLFFSILSIFLLAACKDSEPTINANLDGVFQGNITMYDSTGVIWQKGSINFTQIDSTNLKGNWNFLNGESGELVGIMNDTEVQINLNPNFVDNNTLLEGNFDNTTLSGKWFHISFMGINDKGTFVVEMQ